MDSSPLAHAYCTRRGLRVVDGSLPDALPFEPASLDVIVMTEVLEHVEEDAQSVHAAVRLLREGGLLICTVPAHQWMWSRHDELNHHRRRYTRRRFASLFSSQPLKREVLGFYNVALFPVMAGVRLVSRATRFLAGVNSRDSAAGTDHGSLITPLPGPVNGLLTWMFESEKHILPRVPLPCGASLISVHRR